MAHESVKVSSLPDCDFCKFDENKTTPAEYDFKTRPDSPGRGSWANGCQRHFDEYGTGKLGLGIGQRLVVENPAGEVLE